METPVQSVMALFWEEWGGGGGVFLVSRKGTGAGSACGRDEYSSGEEKKKDRKTNLLVYMTLVAVYRELVVWYKTLKLGFALQVQFWSSSFLSSH